MQLRPYQLNARDFTIGLMKQGERSALGVLPTGCGKTIVFASLIKRVFPRRTMVIAHRQELIWQAHEKIKRVTGFHVDVEMGDMKSNENGLFVRRAPVIVSTMQTHSSGGDGAGRISKFDPSEFGLLVIDEAHHSISPSYRRIINYYRTNPNLFVLGVTATPDRSDEEALGQVFENVAFDYEISDAIKDGWLVPVEQEFINVDSLDFSQVRTTAGDLNGKDLAEVMEAERNLYGIAYPTIDIVGNDKRGIGFASSVIQARRLSELFNRHRKGSSAFVSGATPREERAKIIKDFANGIIRFLWNCNVFTEGFDDSGVDIISMGRPTKSRSLYAQMVGRGTRPHESIAHSLNGCPNSILRRMLIKRSIKPSCLVIDFAGNSGKHKLITTADILGGNYSDNVVETAIKFSKRVGGRVNTLEILEEEEKRAEEARKRREAEEARRANIRVTAKYTRRHINPFDVLDIKPAKQRGWDDKKILTEKQKGFLRKFGFDPESLEYARARQLIGIIMERIDKKRCSFAQIELLCKFGYSESGVKDWSSEQASKAIDAIKANGWKRPQVFEATPQPTSESSDQIIDSDNPF